MPRVGTFIGTTTLSSLTVLSHPGSPLSHRQFLNYLVRQVYWGRIPPGSVHLKYLSLSFLFLLETSFEGTELSVMTFSSWVLRMPLLPMTGSFPVSLRLPRVPGFTLFVGFKSLFAC